METEINIRKPIPIHRNNRLDLKLMAAAYTKYGLEIIDYVFVNNRLPSVK